MKELYEPEMTASVAVEAPEVSIESLRAVVGEIRQITAELADLDDHTRGTLGIRQIYTLSPGNVYWQFEEKETTTMKLLLSRLVDELHGVLSNLANIKADMVTTNEYISKFIGVSSRNTELKSSGWKTKEAGK